MGRVLIVSRTKMRNNVCVGGIDIDKRKFVRLHTEHGANLPEDAPYKIGEVWEMILENPWNPRKAPHKEDMMVIEEKRLGVFPQHVLSDKIEQTGVQIVKGSIEQTFDKCLKFTTNGKGFINEENVPSNSVSLWITDSDIIPIENYGKTFFRYKNIMIPYVGFQTAERISAGTLVRLSLANWWVPDDGDCEARCYLQLSGWY